MGKHSTPGEGLVNRMAARSELKRVSLPGGGEVYSGPTASKALQAMGADAMTVDKSVIVQEGFDVRRPTDAALYAHEMYHVEQGEGGDGGTHAIHSAEEVAARAVERMVFHRMAGGAEAGYQPGAGTGAPVSGGKTPDHGGRGQSSHDAKADAKPAAVKDQEPDPRRGYLALKAQGLTHEDIVARLAREFIAAQDDVKEVGRLRFKDLKGSL